MKRYEDSIKILEPLLSDNNNVVTLVNLGIAYFHSGDAEKSYELLNAAYKKNPKIPEIHLYIGNCLKKFGEDEKAQKAFQRYLILSGKIDVNSDAQNSETKESSKQIDSEEKVMDNTDEINSIPTDKEDDTNENIGKDEIQSDEDGNSDDIE